MFKGFKLLFFIISQSSSGEMNLSCEWVPLETHPSKFSAISIANIFDKRVLLIVEITQSPFGWRRRRKNKKNCVSKKKSNTLSKSEQTLIKEDGFTTCSKISEARTTSNFSPVPTKSSIFILS